MFKNRQRIRKLEDKLWTLNQRISDLEVWCSSDVKIVMIAKWLQNPDCDISMFREKLRKMKEEE